MKKRIIALICLALAALCIYGAVRIVLRLLSPAYGFSYAVLEDGTAVVTRYGGRKTELEIPASLDGHPVSRIGEKAFFWNIRLESVAVPEGVAEIGGGAFAGCERLARADLPKSLEVIGEKAFADCAALDGIAIPGNVAEIGGGAFTGCAGLTRIALPAGVALTGENPFSDCPRLTRVEVAPEHPALAVDGGALFDRDGARLVWVSQAAEAAEYAIPPGTAVVGGGAFQNCAGLTRVDVPGGVTAIGDHAFYGCRKLAAIDLPEGVASIGNGAFSNCAGLARAALPQGLAEIGYLAFYNCRALSAVDIPDSVTAIGDGAFIGCRDLTLTVGRHSYAEIYSRNNGLRFVWRSESAAATE